MALKDKWTDKVDGVDDILAEDINSIAREVIDIEEQMSDINFTETDPTVPGWAKQPEKPKYTADEVGALSADTEIPSIEGLATEKYVDDKIDLVINITVDDDDNLISDKSNEEIISALDGGRNVIVTVSHERNYFKSSMVTKYTYPNGNSEWTFVMIDRVGNLSSMWYSPYENAEHPWEYGGSAELLTDKNAYFKQEVDDKLKNYIPIPEVAEIGQTIVVKEIDENGKPTQWEVVDVGGGTTEEKWELITSGELTEEVSLLTLDGFDCSKVTLHLKVKGSVTNTKECGLLLRTNKNANNGGGNNSALTRLFRPTEDIAIEAYMVFGVINRWILGVVQDSSASGRYSNYYGHDSITAVYLQPTESGFVFGVGSTYELWGVRN